MAAKLETPRRIDGWHLPMHKKRDGHRILASDWRSVDVALRVLLSGSDLEGTHQAAINVIAQLRKVCYLGNTGERADQRVSLRHPGIEMEIAKAMSPVSKARIAGGFYLITVVGSIYSYVIAPGTGAGHASGLIAGTANLVVTLLLYDLLRPVNPLIALLAVFFNIEGSAHEHDPLAFFGCFCLCTGYLIYKSTFIPRLLGGGMVLAGIGLLTNAYAPLLMPSRAHQLSSIGFTLNGIGEISLVLWLIIVGLDEQRWHELKHIGSARHH